ncbi:MAG: patatin-like phospholipase family protein [Candidatus Obscuribacterales bacterium]|jgi:NTE family protein
MRQRLVSHCLLACISGLSVLLPAQAEDASPPNAATRQQKKLVLALGGGGTRGAAHIGVLKVLAKNGIKIDAIVGTSIGAIVGGLYCSGLSAEEIEEIVLKKSFLRSYLTVPIPIRVMAVPLFFIPHLFGYHPYDGLYRGNRFKNYINAQAPLENKSIQGLPITFGAVCCDLLTAEPYVIRAGDLGRAIQASSAIPALRRPVPFDISNPDNLAIKDGQPTMALLVDGGIQANLPAEQANAMAKELGNENEVAVIAINIDESFEHEGGKSFRRIGSVSKRVINIMLASIDRPQKNLAQLTIQPRTNGIALLSTKTRDVKRAIKAGEDAAQLALPKIKAIVNQQALSKDY